MYKAFTTAFMGRSWNLGAIFWHWEMDSMDVGGYTPQGKPAEKILQSVFKTYC